MLMICMIDEFLINLNIHVINNTQLKLKSKILNCIYFYWTFKLYLYYINIFIYIFVLTKWYYIMDKLQLNYSLFQNVDATQILNELKNNTGTTRRNSQHL